MADNPGNKASRDRRIVNANEPWEIQYWTKKFGCTEKALKDAVKSAGNSVEKIRDYLNTNNNK